MLARRNVWVLALVALLWAGGCSGPETAPLPSAAELLPGAGADWQTAERLTRSAGVEYQADYHPATDRLLFVSDRDGGADLYAQRNPRVPLEPAQPVAFHSARDLWPRLSPDGRSVVFVSTRANSRGDLWRYERGGLLRGSRMRRLTDAETADDQPAWHPDGRRILHASSQEPEGGYELWMLSPEGVRERLTEGGGQMPDVSPDRRYVVFVSKRGGGKPGLWVLRLEDRGLAQLTSGPELDLYPCWNADGTGVFFVRSAFDTTGDGRLDLDDATSIFSVRFDERLFSSEAAPPRARQLTSFGTSESFPRPFGDGFLFTRAAPGAGADIYALGPTGEMPDLREPAAFLRFARRADAEEEDVYRRHLAWQNAVWAAQALPGASAQQAAEARLGLGRVYRQMGLAERARAEFAAVEAPHPSACVPVGEARLELLALEVALKPGDAEALTRVVEVALALEREYRERASLASGALASGLRGVAASALLKAGRAELARRRHAAALVLFETVLSRYPREGAVCAEALLGAAEVYGVIGEPDALLNAYLAVLERYPEQEAAAARAAQRAVDVVVRPEAGFEESLSGLRRLVEEYREVRVLPALAQNAIGDLFHARGEHLAAAEQYRRTIEEFPDETEQAAAAYLALAHIRLERQEYDGAVDTLREMQERHGRAGRDLAGRARRGLIRSLLLKAEREKALGDFGLAADTYLTLLAMEPDSAAAHRGLAEAYARLGRTEEAILRYREQVRASPADHQAHYALALAYSYFGPDDWVGHRGRTRQRVGIDRRALELVDRAITLEPDVAYYHQLRGFLLQRLTLATDDTETKLRALDAYLAALGLADRELDPANYANLLLNVGEGYTLIERPAAAFAYYRRAVRAGFPLTGERAFAAVRNMSRSAKAAGQYATAARLLRQLLDQMPSPAGDVGAMRRQAEVLDRLALALNLDADYPAAVETYRLYAEAVGELIEADPAAAPGYRRNLLRGYRNQAVNLYLAAAAGQGAEEALEEAFRLLRAAVQRLEAVGVVEPERGRTAGLITIEVEVGVRGGEPAAEFDAAAEGRLLYTYMGRISAAAGDYRQAVDYLERKLELYPELPRGTERTDLLTEQAVVWSQVGGYLVAAHDMSGAQAAYRRAADLEARAGNLEGEAAATVAFGRVVLTAPGRLPPPQRADLIARHRRLLEALRRADSAHLLEAEAALRTNLAALLDLGDTASEETG